MSQKSTFFSSINGDRAYNAQDWAEHIKAYFTNGVFNNSLKVVENNSMSVIVQAGNANIEGYRYINTDDLTLNIDNADGVLDRIDNIVLRWDFIEREITAKVIKGAFALNPIAPELIRNATTYDLRLAKVYVQHGIVEIQTENIEDTRHITNDCGDVVSTVQTINTDNIFLQYQAAFMNWLDSIKDVLDGDTAGNLLNLIYNRTSTTPITITNDSELNDIVNGGTYRILNSTTGDKYVLTVINHENNADSRITQIKYDVEMWNTMVTESMNMPTYIPGHSYESPVFDYFAIRSRGACGIDEYNGYQRTGEWSTWAEYKASSILGNVSKLEYEVVEEF